MAVYYVDSSALVKPYVAEAGAEWVTALLRSQQILVSTLSIAEAASAFGRRGRETNAGDGLGRELFETFLRQVLRFRVLDLTGAIVETASRFLLTSGPVHLRTLDALHLATAQQSFILAASAGMGEGTLVSADRRLLAAAAAAGLRTENPEDHA
ncbi:MAG: type II toxin-antitoxin system VapC family toxin [Chloroflexota bacterium]|nr:type II toxin-antitoxin system VapC family toxin [Chloroflexota bacterium]